MGLLTIIKKVKQREREMRLLMVGLDNAGKTTIVKKFNGEPIDRIEPTLGFNIKTLEFLGYKLNVWDVGGQATLRAYWRNYFEATDGLIWVVDSADTRRLEDCRTELKKLLVQEKLAGASLLVFANKQDLPGALSPEKIYEFWSSQSFQRVAIRRLCHARRSVATDWKKGCDGWSKTLPQGYTCLHEICDFLTLVGIDALGLAADLPSQPH